jgi:hypothetical protein
MIGTNDLQTIGYSPAKTARTDREIVEALQRSPPEDLSAKPVADTISEIESVERTREPGNPKSGGWKLDRLPEPARRLPRKDGGWENVSP